MSSTGNPRHPNNPPSDYPQEPTGAVAKDSLANESIQSGGGFSENDNPEVLGVKGYQSTLNNDDTSNADKLRPARDAASRIDDQSDLDRGVKYPSEAGNPGFTGTISQEGYAGGTSASAGSGGVSSSSGRGGIKSDSNRDDATTYSGGADVGSTTNTDRDQSQYQDSVDTSGTTGVRPFVNEAPTGVASELRTQGELQPKGDNLTDLTGDYNDTTIPPNRSTFTGDVGGQKDPGRLAEQKFQKDASDASSGVTRDYTDGGVNQYDALDPSTRA